MKNLLIGAIILGFIACSPAEKGTIYWVNSYTVDCVGVSPMKCLQIQKGENMVEGEWQNFYSQIEGFDYEPGYIYKIRVNEEVMENVPADASSVQYKLIEVLEKNEDARLALSGTELLEFSEGTEAKVLLNDIWVAETVDGTSVQNTSHPPRLEIHTAEMEVMGEDGCNRFTGKINKLTNKDLVFAPLASTKKACPDMTIPDKFNKAMAQVKYYKITGLNLTLLNDEEKVLVVLKKSD